MISINLIPDNKRKKQRRGGLLPVGFVLPREIIVGLIGGFIVLLAATHILFQFVILVKFADLKGRQVYWNKVLPEKEQVDVIVKGLRSRQLRIRAMNDLQGSSGISWAKKLNAISSSILRGIWLRSIELKESSALIHGSSVSKHKLEMIAIHNFVKKLKENKMFMSDINLIELDSIKSRKVGDLPVADFMIRIELEHDEEVDKKDKAKK